MKTTWRTARLGEVLTQDKQYVRALEAREYPKLSVKLYGRGCVVDGFARGDEVRMQRHQLAKPGQVILSEIWGKKGAIGFVPADGAAALVTSHFFLFDLRGSHISKDWLKWLFRASYFEPELAEQARGSTGYAAVRPRQFLDLTFPLPPLDEQWRIVARIEALAGRIAEAQELQETAACESEAILAATGARIFNQLASTHPSRPIGDTFSFRSDLVRPGDGAKGQWRFIGLQHIEPHTGRRTGEDLLQAEELTGRKFKFSPGEIVYGYLRPYLNKVWIADCDGLCSVDQYVLRPKRESVDTEYLAHFMRSQIFVDQAIERTHSLLLPRLHSGLLASIQIPLPGLEEQRRAVRQLDKLRANIDALRGLQKSSQTELAALLPAVLDKAFRGEL